MGNFLGKKNILNNSTNFVDFFVNNNNNKIIYILQKYYGFTSNGLYSCHKSRLTPYPKRSLLNIS